MKSVMLAAFVFVLQAVAEAQSARDPVTGQFAETRENDDSVCE